MPTSYDGYYINLDRSPDRRAKMEKQLDRLGLRDTYRRFPAVDGATLPPRLGLTGGEQGIFRSHLDILAATQAAGRPIHVLEDDAVFSQFTAPVIDLFVQSGVLDAYDMVFTETLVPQDLRALKQFKAFYDNATTESGEFNPAKLQIIDLANVRFAGTTSYVVNPKSVGRLMDLYRRGWTKDRPEPFDLFLRTEVLSGRIRAACCVPFVSTIDLDEIARSTARRTGSKADEESTGLIMALLRYSFFVGRDLDSAHALLSKILAQTVDRRPDRHRLLIEKILGFVLSGHFRIF